MDQLFNWKSGQLQSGSRHMPIGALHNSVALSKASFVGCHIAAATDRGYMMIISQALIGERARKLVWFQSNRQLHVCL